jgi:L-rhamnose mutarotase
VERVMQRVVMSLKLKPERRAEYLHAHQQVWPELIEVARKAGLRNHSVFMRGDDLVLYAEAEDLGSSLASFLATDVKRRWDDAMKPFFDKTGSDNDAWQEVFHFD